MGHSGEGFQIFLRNFGVGNCKKFLIDLGLRAKVAETKNTIGKRRNLAQNRQVSEDQKNEAKPSW